MIVDKQFLLDTALRLAEAAYTVSSDTPSVPDGYTFVSTIKVNISLGTLSADNPYFGLILLSGGVLYVLIRGTASLDEWIDDFDATPVNCGPYKVHAGFERVFEAVLPSVATAVKAAVNASAKEICIIGHSLGAAVATRIASWLATGTSLPLNCIVFASPRVGDSAFQSFVDAKVNLLRVTNTKDLVTHVPPRPEYVHAGEACVFDGWSIAKDLAQRLDTRFEHSLELSYGPGVDLMPDQLVRVALS